MAPHEGSGVRFRKRNQTDAGTSVSCGVAGSDRRRDSKAGLGRARRLDGVVGVTVWQGLAQSMRLNVRSHRRSPSE
jgi:hypothetical protein